ncbi:MAG: DUF1934 family protein, partial [Anaerovoracaceae bacterium]
VEPKLSMEKGERHEGIVETPFGPAPIEFLTNNIKNNLLENGEGEIEIDFEVALGGHSEGRNQINISVLKG